MYRKTFQVCPTEVTPTVGHFRRYGLKVRNLALKKKTKELMVVTFLSMKAVNNGRVSPFLKKIMDFLQSSKVRKIAAI